MRQQISYVHKSLCRSVMLCVHLMMIVANKQNYPSATNTLNPCYKRTRSEAQYLPKFFFLSCNDFQGCFQNHAHIQFYPSSFICRRARIEPVSAPESI